MQSQLFSLLLSLTRFCSPLLNFQVLIRRWRRLQVDVALWAPPDSGPAPARLRPGSHPAPEIPLSAFILLLSRELLFFFYCLLQLSSSSCSSSSSSPCKIVRMRLPPLFFPDMVDAVVPGRSAGCLRGGGGGRVSLVGDGAQGRFRDSCVVFLFFSLSLSS